MKANGCIHNVNPTLFFQMMVRYICFNITISKNSLFTNSILKKKQLVDFRVRLLTMKYMNSNAIVLLRNAQNSRKKKHACREYLLLPKCCNRKSVFYLCVGESQVRRKLRTNACSFLWMFYLFLQYVLQSWRMKMYISAKENTCCMFLLCNTVERRQCFVIHK